MSIQVVTNHLNQSVRSSTANCTRLENRSPSVPSNSFFQSKTFVVGALLGGVVASCFFYKYFSAQTANLSVPSPIALSPREVLSQNIGGLLQQQERNTRESPPLYLQSLKQGIERGDGACLGGIAVQAEEFYANALQKSLKENNRIGEAICLQRLAELYIKKGTRQSLVQAAGMYQYVLLCLPEGENRQLIKRVLGEIETKLIAMCNGGVRKKEVLSEQFENNARALKSLREHLDGKIQEMSEQPSPEDVFTLNREITLQLKGFIRGLMDQVIELQGKPPCNFSVIGFGSLAREEMTPYSDFEFGVLVDENTESNKEYFRNFSHLLHLKVVNLGETILRALNIPCLSTMYSLDSRTPRGFAFDGEGAKGKGCKTPLGNRKTFELIQTPEEMAKYQEKDPHGNWWFEKEPHLPMELSTFTHLAGDKELVRKYQEAMDSQLKVPFKEHPSRREFYARELLRKEDEETFDPTLWHLTDEGRLFQVKQDLYRLPHLLIDRLTLLSDYKLPEQGGIRQHSTVDRIDWLYRHGVIGVRAKENLTWLVSTTSCQRLKVYSSYKKQREEMNPLLHSFTQQDPSQHFALHPENLEILIKIYQILIPFYRHVWVYLRKEKGSLLEEDFRDTSSFTRGIIEERLMQYERAYDSYLQAEKEAPVSWEVKNLIGSVLYKLGRNSDSLGYHQKAMSLAGDSTYFRAVTYGWIGIILESLGKGREALENKTEALRLFQSLRETESKDKEIKDYFHLLVTFTNNLAMSNKSQHDYEKALELLKKCREITERIYPNGHPKLAGVLSNMSMIYIEQGKFEDALDCLNRARAIDEKFYGMQHPSLARDFVNLGLLERKKGQNERAMGFYEKALSIYRDLDYVDPKIGSTYRNLGIAHKKLRNLQEAINNFKKASEVLQSIYGSDHYLYIYSLIDLGSAYRSLGHPGAIQCLEEARVALSVLEQRYCQKLCFSH